MTPPRPPRILVVDDDPAVLDAYRRILQAPAGNALGAARAALFDEVPATTPEIPFAPEVFLVSQGQEAIDAVASPVPMALSVSAPLVPVSA